ncbi:hypothetical protein HQ587_00900 [bacterium]|nr:hypothetical protein [bacterium]
MDKDRPNWLRRNARWISIPFLLVSIIVLIIVFASNYIFIVALTEDNSINYKTTARLLQMHIFSELVGDFGFGALPNEDYSLPGFDGDTLIVQPASPFNNVSRSGWGFLAGEDLVMKPVIDQVTPEMLDKLKKKLKRQARGRIKIAGHDGKAFFCPKPFGENISFNWGYIDTDSLTTYLPQIIEKAVKESVFRWYVRSSLRFSAPETPDALKKFEVEGSSLIVEIVRGDDKIYTLGEASAESIYADIAEYTRQPLPYLEDMELVISASTPYEAVFLKVAKRLRGVSVIALILLMTGIVLLWVKR